MSYNNKQLVRMTFPSHDFGTGGEIFSFRLPLNEHGVAQKGRLVNIGVSLTEAVVGSSTPAIFELGTAADNDAFAKLNIPNAAADEDCFDVSDDTDAILDENIPAGTLVEVNYTAPTGGTPAGIGVPFIDVYVW